MKRFMILSVLFSLCFSTMFAQEVFRTFDMQDVTRTGSKCEYDEESCIATFTGNSDRWLDVPNSAGDLSGHTKLSFELLKSNVILGIYVRYKDEAGKTRQVSAGTLYRQMGKVIDGKKLITVDLSNKGKVTEEMLKKVTSIRISMGKPATDSEEPWEVTFGKMTLN